MSNERQRESVTPLQPRRADAGTGAARISSGTSQKQVISHREEHQKRDMDIVFIDDWSGAGGGGGGEGSCTDSADWHAPAHLRRV